MTASASRTKADISSERLRGMPALYDRLWAILVEGPRAGSLMRLTIRTKLAVLVLAVLLPLLAAAAIKFWSDLSEGRRLAHQNQLDVARLVAAQLDEVLTGQIESLLAI